MKIHITNTRQIYEVTKPCSVEIPLELDTPLNTGDRIQFQFPNSWSLVTGPSYTRKFQFDNPEAEHYLSVTTGNNASGLDFAAAADHWESLGPEGYRILKQWAESANKPGIFTTILADERNPGELGGHHNVYFLDREDMEQHQAVQETTEGGQANSLNKLRNANPERIMLIPHHTGIIFGDLRGKNKGAAVDWNATDDFGLRPVMEIYSHHGQSETYNPQHFLAYEYNRMRNPERRANTSVPGKFYAQDYWMQGKRIGVIASSDEHSGQGGRRHGGITAVFAESLTREGVFRAIRQRRCYATTGERILLEFTVGACEMGKHAKHKRGAEIDIILKVRGTNTLLRVEILKHTFKKDTTFTPVISTCPAPTSMDAEISCRDTIEDSCMYYARIVQEPFEWPAMAWTSPIWIDAE